jgi:hypothetical protein
VPGQTMTESSRMDGDTMPYLGFVFALGFIGGIITECGLAIAVFGALTALIGAVLVWSS